MSPVESDTESPQILIFVLCALVVENQPGK
jgi:hypothetical protein